jgi:hypothetical protein
MMVEVAMTVAVMKVAPVMMMTEMPVTVMPVTVMAAATAHLFDHRLGAGCGVLRLRTG